MMGWESPWPRQSVKSLPTVSSSLHLIHCYVREEKDPTPNHVLKLNKSVCPLQLSDSAWLVQMNKNLACVVIAFFFFFFIPSVSHVDCWPKLIFGFVKGVHDNIQQ